MGISELVEILLKNRGLTDPEDVADFFRPPRPEDISISVLGWTGDEVKTAIDLISRHLSAGHPIAVYGDYDVDGITSAAILWETLYHFSPAVFPFIPHRRRDGYGLTRSGISGCLERGAKLIIAADSGITAVAEVDYCRQQNCDILIIDHHQPPARLPDSNALLFSTATSAAGLSWFFTRELLSSPFFAKNRVIKGENSDKLLRDHLSLCAISVICDLVPLLGLNRSFARYGLAELNTTVRPGLLALITRAGLIPGRIGPYEVGFVIGPRLNAMGRLEHALDSLRLLCTSDLQRAGSLAQTLDETNRQRQDLTVASVKKAVTAVSPIATPGVILVSDASFDEGIIGLVAARLVEEFYRPALVISSGHDPCKGSGRSVPGFNLIGFLRQFSDLLLSVGGHEMAGGFSVAAADLDKFTAAVTTAAAGIDSGKFIKKRNIDAEISLDLVTQRLFDRLEEFTPFGLGNPRPVFFTPGLSLSAPKWVGRDASHLKFSVSGLEAIYFRTPPGFQLPAGPAGLVYSLDKNTYNGGSRLQLIVKDVYGSPA